MYTVFGKLYMARLLLSLKLKEIAEQSGINQIAISLLEHGERINIPVEYVQFLYKKGIDINRLFDENENITSVFRKEYNKDLEDVTEQLKNLKPDNFFLLIHLTNVCQC